LLNKGKFLFGISAFGVLEYFEWFCIKSCKWGTSHKLTWSLFFPAVLFYGFCLSCSVFLFLSISLWGCLLLASSMFGSWWSQWESCDSEVTIIHANIDGPWTGVRPALLFILPSCLTLFFGPSFSVFSSVLWNSLWLVEEVLALLCLFWIIRMEISEFLWEIYPEYWEDKSAGDKTFNSSKSRNWKKVLEST
jgi:hypothetical protein